MQVGAALALAVTTALVTTGDDGTTRSPEQMLDQFRPGLVFVTIVALAGLAVTLLPMLQRRRNTEDDEPPTPDGTDLVDALTMKS